MNKFNPLIDDLVREFSYEDVFAPNDEKTIIHHDDVINLYNILNKHLFSLALKQPHIEFTDDYIGTNHIAGYNYKFVQFKDANTYTLVTRLMRIPNGVILIPPRILLNPILSHGIALMFCVNALAHEMIHQDDVENGTLLQRKYDSKMKGEKDFNSHKGYFEKFANEINMKFNLNVKPEGSNVDDETTASIAAVRKALLEDEHSKAKMLNELEYSKLSDGEKLKRSKENLENNEFVECKYLGNGAFEETLF